MKDGSLAVPKGPNNVAWYEDGSMPGDIGNAVMNGHFGWKDGIPAVFDDLHLLQIGDKIVIQNKNGEILNFVVVNRMIFDKGADASKVFVSEDGRSHLNLITCKGIWSKTDKSYSERLVIFADLENVED